MNIRKQPIPPYAIQADTYQTSLSPEDDVRFSQWMLENKVPYDPKPTGDYGMKGFWQALQKGDPIATTAINPNDNKIHYPDYFKTPYHKSFSNESRWAIKDKAPFWNKSDQLVMPDGTVIYDERASK